MDTGYNIWLTLGGIGMLIYGMVLMEEGISKVMKSKIQQKLEHYTKSKRYSFLIGVGATAATQSSSLISLLLLVFVGAGMISLQSSIAVIIGSNIGTTFTSLLVAWLGFGKFSITAFAFPLIAISGIGLLFVKNRKRRYILKIIMSFGLIFFGIDLIKDSVESLKSLVDFSEYAHLGIFGFFLIGVVLTAIIQSSHTVVIITLAALHGGIITFPLALGIVIGSNIGTTVTVLFAALGSTGAKKQVAYAHLGFNIILSVIGLIYYGFITWILIDVIQISDNPVINLAIFNTVLNTITAIVILPFLGQFVRFVLKYTEHNNTKKTPHLHIERINKEDKIMSSFPGIVIHSLTLDIKYLLLETCRYSIQVFDRDIVKKRSSDKDDNTKKQTLISKILFRLVGPEQADVTNTYTLTQKEYDQENHKNVYESAKKDIETMLPAIFLVEKDELTSEQQRKQQAIETTINYCIESMKHIKAIREDLETLRSSQNPIIKTYYTEVKEDFLALCKDIINFTIYNSQDVNETWKSLEHHKSIYKENRRKSTETFEKLSKLAIDAGFPISTLFNIERHLLVAQKYIIKAWKSYLSILHSPLNHSSFKTLVHDLYDDAGPEDTHMQEDVVTNQI